MIIRKYLKGLDFMSVQKWVLDERIHFLWCAGRFDYPLDQENFENVLENHKNEYNDNAYLVIDDQENPVGFFVCNDNEKDNSAFLKFVVLNNELRGKGNGVKMLQCISEYLVSEKNVMTIGLVVFDINMPARKCYEKAGFVLVSEEKDVFTYKNESWGRCRMVCKREIQE